MAAIVSISRRTVRTGPITPFYLLLVLLAAAVLAAAQLNLDDERSNSEICESVDIRNTLDTFERLRGCHVVEGFVQILLFDNVNETELSLLSFPNLTEITDYLLLYRVNGLRSVGQLFPNLNVIRGQNTFYSYSFVIFEMSTLQEIGLYSLTQISSGLIRIDKNPSLCFVNSIDWSLIAQEKGEHFIKSIKSPNECPICPGEDKNDELGSKSDCPLARASSENYGRDTRLCWNRQHCQKICPSHCKYACTDMGDCCDESCLGGCVIRNDTTSQCTVCKNVSIGFGENKMCRDSCPSNQYQYLKRRCIEKHECKEMRKPLNYQSGPDRPYKIYENSCILECPANYMNNDTHCIPCQGTCMKKCPGANVDSITLVKQFKGCTHINGSLEIQIRGGRNVVIELEENLGMIEEIDGYLKIVRSFPLVSLSFLKNLKAIRGTKLESQKYVFVVLDNQNLQELWNWKVKKDIRIDNGRLFFHFNPKLCLNEIETLQNITKIVNVTDLEVAKNSNGDKVACDLEQLKINISSITDSSAILRWETFKPEGDARRLLGYIVHSIKAPTQNVTLYDGRDACGPDSWRVDDYRGSDEDKVTYPLLSLDPYTQYAIFVKTFTILSERKGAQSNISYFTTLPSTPSPPINLQVTSNSSDSLKLFWKPPKQKNGKLSHYLIVIKHTSENLSTDQLDYYCKSPFSRQKHTIPSPTSAPPVIPTINDTCSCNEEKTSKVSINPSIETSRIAFEDELQNTVYVKNTNKAKDSRTKRNVPAQYSVKELDDNRTGSTSVTGNHTDPITGTWNTFSTQVTGTEFYIQNLHHFSVYKVTVQACREITNDPEDKKSPCSNTVLQTYRTLRKKTADDVKMVLVTNKSLDMVSITWKEPDDPNGIILSYTIEYKKVDNENYKANEECITHARFLNQSRIHTIKSLLPGNYSLRVFATTYAENGAFSAYTYFHIEQQSSYTGAIISGVITVSICVGIIVALMMYRRKKADRETRRLIPWVNPEYIEYVPDDWEVPRKKIELMRELGQGSFGMVYEGIGKDLRGKSEIKCAVKTVNEHATDRERAEFLNEASVMKAFDTAHVVRLLGVVSQGQPTLVIMELMANGDLKSYLRSHRLDADVFDSLGKQRPTLKQILQMAIEIADGMAYLSAMKFVHRDLAARNCMVAEDLTVKIGDFGMTRDIYETDYYRKGTKGLLPVRWMAPESLKDGVFTSNSDVWSYGVVLWEMATLASQPYQGLSNEQVLRYVIDRGVMERPENCPDKLYTLMRYCWQHKASARPSFLKLCSMLLEDASTSFAQVSFYHSAAGKEARSIRPAPSPSQDEATMPLRRDGDFSLNSDESNDEFDENESIRYPSSPLDNSKETTANGFVTARPNNGAATTQC